MPVVIACALAVLLTATGCPAGPSSSGATGTVVKSKKDKTQKGVTYYEITVREDSGKRDTGRVTRGTWKACQVGDRWPACKKG